MELAEAEMLFVKFAGYVALFSPVIVALIQFLKKLGFNKKFSLLAAIVFGVALSFRFMPEWKDALILGAITGFSAVGLYSGAKNLTEGVKAIAQSIKH